MTVENNPHSNIAFGQAYIMDGQGNHINDNGQSITPDNPLELREGLLKNVDLDLDDIPLTPAIISSKETFAISQTTTSSVPIAHINLNPSKQNILIERPSGSERFDFRQYNKLTEEIAYYGGGGQILQFLETNIFDSRADFQRFIGANHDGWLGAETYVKALLLGNDINDYLESGTLNIDELSNKEQAMVDFYRRQRSRSVVQELLTKLDTDNVDQLIKRTRVSPPRQVLNGMVDTIQTPTSTNKEMNSQLLLALATTSKEQFFEMHLIINKAKLHGMQSLHSGEKALMNQLMPWMNGQFNQSDIQDLVNRLNIIIEESVNESFRTAFKLLETQMEKVSQQHNSDQGSFFDFSQLFVPDVDPGNIQNGAIAIGDSVLTSESDQPGSLVLNSTNNLGNETMILIKNMQSTDVALTGAFQVAADQLAESNKIDHQLKQSHNSSILKEKDNDLVQTLLKGVSFYQHLVSAIKNGEAAEFGNFKIEVNESGQISYFAKPESNPDMSFVHVTKEELMTRVMKQIHDLKSTLQTSQEILKDNLEQLEAQLNALEATRDKLNDLIEQLEKNPPDLSGLSSGAKDFLKTITSGNNKVLLEKKTEIEEEIKKTKEVIEYTSSTIQDISNVLKALHALVEGFKIIDFNQFEVGGIPDQNINPTLTKTRGISAQDTSHLLQSIDHDVQDTTSQPVFNTFADQLRAREEREKAHQAQRFEDKEKAFRDNQAKIESQQASHISNATTELESAQESINEQQQASREEELQETALQRLAANQAVTDKIIEEAIENSFNQSTVFQGGGEWTYGADGSAQRVVSNFMSRKKRRGGMSSKSVNLTGQHTQVQSARPEDLRKNSPVAKTIPESPESDLA